MLREWEKEGGDIGLTEGAEIHSAGSAVEES